MSPVRRLLLVATLGIAVWAPAAASPLLTCAAAAGAVPAGSVAVSVVIDTGTTSASPGGTQSTCVTVAEGSTGIDALQARARQLGRPGPRFNSSGLLCAIDGFPETGCGEATGADFLYWSYWVGTQSQWYYANLGPGSRKVTNGMVEGWRFLQGTGRSSEQAPREVPQPCAVTPTTTDTVRSPAVVASDSTSRAATITAAPAPTESTTGSVTRTRGKAPSTTVVPSSTTTSLSSSSSTTITSSSTITSSTTIDPRTRRVESASAPSGTSGDGDGSGLVTVVGVAAVASLAMAGLWVARHRAAQ